MALPASTLLPTSSSSSFSSPSEIKLFGYQSCQVQKNLVLLGTRHQALSRCALKVSMSQSGGPENVNMKINDVKEKLQKAIPDSVKELEWEKGADILVQQLLSLGQKAFKWLTVVLIAVSFLSDVIFTISRNQELVMPFGLLAGCLLADFFKETSIEVFPNSQGKRLNWNLIVIGCFFVLVKFISAFFGIRGKVFILHVANGGFLQVLWLWTTLLKGKNEGNQENSLSQEHDSLAIEAND
ncbi:uncharacterized protein LOC115712783 [Cannabis sativa]|uniref:Uncharacterized protein n=3 Tax=Cannabis sativa TaxID=3483 RepID=A0A7J6EA08_CANSA|nr:uncharacterized protein LOC115712783 [Cannabis sativa]KAF4355268.1 hypothetical protein G4B88_018234 [Cannabis sativa]